MNENRLKEDGNPQDNVGALWNKIGSKEDYMLMKITIDEPGNHTFVIFKNHDKGETDEEFYDKKPAHFIFPYKPKNKELNHD